MKDFAIIGVGPRGLFGLERLLISLEKTNKPLKITLFEPSDNPGASHVWDINQASSNLVNINERALTGLIARPEIIFDNKKIHAFPSYHNWTNFSQSENDPDTFPPRKKIGKYLNERFLSIAKSLKKSSLFKIIQTKITSINLIENILNLTSEENKTYTFNEILITIGHQPTELAKQLKTWKKHQNSNLFEDPYPVSQFKNLKNKSNITIGIRGFGLAMIDVMRALTINNFGTFKIIDPLTFKTEYKQTTSQNLKLAPFSLDGKPLAPKPLNENIDNWYKPTKYELENFKNEIKKTIDSNQKVDNIDFLIKPISKIASRVFLDLNKKAIVHDLEAKNLQEIALNWLNDEDFEHPILQCTSISTYKLIQYYIAMALGTTPVSFDYCLGQVWRHCQPSLYASFSYAKIDNDIIEKVITLDDRTKRYSYGPPIESMQQILALVDAQILSLKYINNPEIEITNQSWLFKNKNESAIHLNKMINSVLDAPKLLDVNAPIIKSLLNNDLIQPIHTKLGIDTKTDGRVISYNSENQLPISVLGRLSKGSVIGVDAILECFGKRIEDWADAYTKRL